MQKRAVEQLTPDQFSEWIAIDIDARRKGGPNLREKYLRLVEQLPEEIRQEYQARAIELWAKVENDLAKPAEKMRRFSGDFFGPATQPPAEETRKDTGRKAAVSELIRRNSANLPPPDEKREEPDEGAERDEEATEIIFEDDPEKIKVSGHALWRFQSALKFIAAPHLSEEIGAVLRFLSKDEPDAGCNIWVKWIGENGRERWHRGFQRPLKGTANRIYRIAQLNGWRFPIMHNLNQLDKVARLTEAALIGARVSIYQKDRHLVRPVRVTAEAAKKRTTSTAVLEPIEAAYLKASVTRTIDFHKWKGGKEKVRERCGASTELASAILHRFGEWCFPQVTGVITSPTLRPDGTILAKVGLDQATGLYVMGPLPTMDPIPEKPTRRDAEEAVAILDRELLGEFPFCDNASRSVALSGQITPIVRPALTCAPMHAATAPTPGTGKSYLWDTAAAIYIGDYMPIFGTGPNVEELEKRLGIKMMAGETIYSIDNVTMLLAGDGLCQAIERPMPSARILGKSEGPVCRNVWTIYATGNNLRMRDDLTRRAVLCRMDAGIERPELRSFEGSPLERVLANRGRYIRAALVIALAYRAAGMPERLSIAIDPFKEWSDNVRSALVWLGYVDPLQTMEAVRENDPRRQARIALFQAIFNAYGSDPQPAVKMIEHAKSGIIRKPGQRILDGVPSADAENLKGAIIDYTDNRLDSRYLGTRLHQDDGKIFGGLRLCSAPDAHTKIKLWWIKDENAK
jgi:putative DNA primase/helicase